MKSSEFELLKWVKITKQASPAIGSNSKVGVVVEMPYPKGGKAKSGNVRYTKILTFPERRIIEVTITFILSATTPPDVDEDFLYEAEQIIDENFDMKKNQIKPGMWVHLECGITTDGVVVSEPVIPSRTVYYVDVLLFPQGNIKSLPVVRLVETTPKVATPEFNRLIAEKLKSIPKPNPIKEYMVFCVPKEGSEGLAEVLTPEEAWEIVRDIEEELTIHEYIRRIEEARNWQYLGTPKTARKGLKMNSTDTNQKWVKGMRE